jgi:orotate phosphoribosyltransferase
MPEFNRTPYESRDNPYESKKVERTIESMESPAGNLLESMRKEIEQEKYDTILSDDAGARLHSLLLSKVMRTLYKEKDLGTFFIQGGAVLRGEKEVQSRLQEYLSSIKNKLGNNVLFVTQEIATGGSARKVVDILQDLGIQVDIAAFGLSMEDEDPSGAQDDMQKRFPEDVKLFSGKGGQSSSAFELFTGLKHRNIETQGPPEKKELSKDAKEASKIARSTVSKLAIKLANQFPEGFNFDIEEY